MTILWYTRFFAYYGLQFNLEELGTEFILNFTIMGFAEILASLSSAYIKRMYKRKLSMQASLVICCISCVSSQWFPFPVLLAITSKFSITLYYNILVTYTGEIYPTETRTQAYGLLMTIGRLAVISMPVLSRLWNYFTGFYSTHLIAILLLLSALALVGLRETLDIEIVENEPRENKLSISSLSAASAQLDDRRQPLAANAH
jgi:MFS family permease